MSSPPPRPPPPAPGGAFACCRATESLGYGFKSRPCLAPTTCVRALLTVHCCRFESLSAAPSRTSPYWAVPVP